MPPVSTVFHRRCCTPRPPEMPAALGVRWRSSRGRERHPGSIRSFGDQRRLRWGHFDSPLAVCALNADTPSPRHCPITPPRCGDLGVCLPL